MNAKLASHWLLFGMDTHSTTALMKFFLLDSQEIDWLPMAVHGDEGRGKRRSQAVLFSLESVLGIKGHSSCCHDCAPLLAWNAPYGEADGLQHPFQHLLRHNIKGHSFLQHFPLFLLPGTMAKECKTLTKDLITFLAGELKALFHEGVKAGDVTYHIAVIGSKGDLKWVSKIACLTRGFEHQGRVQAMESCHQCLAGGPRIPAEDFSTNPVWERTIHVKRPWDVAKLPCLIEVPFDPERPELLYRNDSFHTLRLGVYRDFSASCIFLLMTWGYFGPGNMDVKLECAHGHFTLWLRTVKKTVALRSFTKSLFNYKSRSSFVWSNTKGSDTVLLCQWLGIAAAGFLAQESDGRKREALSIIVTAAKLSTDWTDIIYKHGIFLTRTCGASLYEKGQAFINAYVWLAGFCQHEQLCLFAVKPKLHFQKHTLLEIYWQLQSGCTSICNPAIFDCCQNEDLIGKMCKLGRKVDTRVITKRCLEFYLIKAAVLLRRHYSVHRDLDAKWEVTKRGFVALGAMVLYYSDEPSNMSNACRQFWSLRAIFEPKVENSLSERKLL